MTLLGQHTIDEVQHLMKTVEFRIQAAERVGATITTEFRNANPEEFAALQFDWNAFKKRWADTREKVLANILLLNAGQPLVPVSMIPDEPDYKRVKKAINVGGEDTFTRGDLMDCILRIEAAAGTRINEKDAPLPKGFDPDFAAYRKTDDAIKASEAAAKTVADAAAKAAKSNTGLLVLGGLGIVVGGVVLTKVYL